MNLRTSQLLLFDGVQCKSTQFLNFDKLILDYVCSKVRKTLKNSPNFNLLESIRMSSYVLFHLREKERKFEFASAVS